MKNFPYYYFTHSNYPYFKSNRSKPSINTKILYNVVIASTGIFALAILTEIYKRYFMNHAYWARWRWEKVREKESFELLIKMNSNFQPKVIKEFSSF